MHNLNSVLAKFAQFMNTNKTIQAVSHALMSLMPALMIGAIGSLLEQIPIPAYQSFITNSGLLTCLQGLVNVSTNLLALYASFAIGYCYANSEKCDGFSAGLITLVSFLVVTPMNTEGSGYSAVTSLPLTWMGSMGLFTSIIVSLVSAKIYCWFVKKNITIKMPESVPSFISKSFAGIIPAGAIGLGFALIAFVMSKTPFGSLHTLIYTMIGAPLSKIGGSIWAALLVYTLSGLCWWFGIHGIAVMSAVMPIWMAADAANVSAISAGGTPTNIVTYNWVNTVGNIGGAGCTLGLILLCTFCAKSKRYKDMGRLAIVPSLFGINEPVVFGLPCMLTTPLLIPFVFSPVVLIALSYVLTVIGILPIGNGLAAPGTIPLVQGMFNGGWKLAVWQAIELVLTIFIYLPFFKKLDKEALKEEEGVNKK